MENKTAPPGAGQGLHFQAGALSGAPSGARYPRSEIPNSKFQEETGAFSGGAALWSTEQGEVLQAKFQCANVLICQCANGDLKIRQFENLKMGVVPWCQVVV